MNTVNTERCKYRNVINHTIYCAAQSERAKRNTAENKLFDAVYEVSLLKNLFGRVEKLIQKSLDPDETSEMSDSLDCLYKALNICKKVREAR